MTDEKAKGKGPRNAAPIKVASVLSLVDAGKLKAKWLDNNIGTAADAYLNIDPNRPGAPALRIAKRFAEMAERCIATGDADGAAWTAAQAVHALWHAEIADGRAMIDGGVKSYRAAEADNLQRKRKAEEKHAEWQRLAAELRQNPQHANKGKSDIARLIDPERWKAIRKHI